MTRTDRSVRAPGRTDKSVRTPEERRLEAAATQEEWAAGSHPHIGIGRPGVAALLGRCLAGVVSALPGAEGGDDGVGDGGGADFGFAGGAGGDVTCAQAGL